MNTYRYKGPDVNLGRFGQVRSGDVLVLTDHEADTVAKDRDKRFEAVREGEKPKPGGSFVPITDKMTADERAAAEARNKAEKDRIDDLQKANNAAQVEIVELREKTWAQLVEIAEKMNAAGGQPQIPTGKKVTKSELVRQILRARGLDAGTAAEQEEDEEPEAEGKK